MLSGNGNRWEVVGQILCMLSALSIIRKQQLPSQQLTGLDSFPGSPALKDEYTGRTWCLFSCDHDIISNWQAYTYLAHCTGLNTMLDQLCTNNLWTICKETNLYIFTYYEGHVSIHTMLHQLCMNNLWTNVNRQSFNMLYRLIHCVWRVSDNTKNHQCVNHQWTISPQ